MMTIIDEIYFDHNVLHAILLSNIKLTITFFKGVFPLRLLHVSSHYGKIRILSIIRTVTPFMV